MNHYLSKITANDAAQALRNAEAELVRPPEAPDGAPVFVDISAQSIKTRLELFQPKRPGWGTKEVDPDHVDRLIRRIKLKGELDPPLVLKLGKDWVVVDGHHRVAAYVKLKHPSPIKCEWFAGSVREATDETLRRNEVVKLPISREDRYEEAWRRTLNGWGSKSDVVKLTGTSEGIVARMRKAVKEHREQTTAKGKALRAKFGPDLGVHPWTKVNMEWLGMAPEEWSLGAAAATLARNINSRMTTLLSENPEVTARALWLYDRDLCPKLVDALQAHMRQQDEAEQAAEDEAAYDKISGEEA
jgi:uncharacterized protein YecA (UPF0149 family)